MGPSGLLDNLFLPWRADVTSAFGGSTLLVLVLATVVVALVRRARMAWPLLLAVAFPFVYSLGRATPLFPFFFAHVPGFSLLRVPGRSFVMLPLVLVLSVLWLRAPRRGQEAEGEPFLEWEARAAALLTVALGLGWLSWLALGLPVATLPEYCPATLSEYWTPARQILWLALGLVAAVTALRARASRPAFVVLILAAAVQTGMIFRHGTWTEERPRTPTREDFRRASHTPLYGELPLQAIDGPARSPKGRPRRPTRGSSGPRKAGPIASSPSCAVAATGECSCPSTSRIVSSAWRAGRRPWRACAADRAASWSRLSPSFC